MSIKFKAKSCKVVKVVRPELAAKIIWTQKVKGGWVQSQRRPHWRPRQSRVHQSVAPDVVSDMVPLGNFVRGGSQIMYVHLH